MADIKIYLHTENEKEPEILSISKTEKIKDFIQKHKERKGFSEKIEEIYLFIEDEDENIIIEHFEEIEFPEKTHLHLHRCKKISVVINYNGKDESKYFSPATTGKKVFEWAIKEFKISPVDALNFEIRINNQKGELLKDTDHIGSFVSHHHCELNLFLVPKVNIQG